MAPSQMHFTRCADLGSPARYQGFNTFTPPMKEHDVADRTAAP